MRLKKQERHDAPLRNQPFPDRAYAMIMLRHGTSLVWNLEFEKRHLSASKIPFLYVAIEFNVANAYTT